MSDPESDARLDDDLDMIIGHVAVAHRFYRKLRVWLVAPLLLGSTTIWACTDGQSVSVTEILAHPQRFEDSIVALRGRLSAPISPGAIPPGVLGALPVVVRYIVADDSLPVIIPVRADTFAVNSIVRLRGRVYTLSLLNGLLRAGPVFIVGNTHVGR